MASRPKTLTHGLGRYGAGHLPECAPDILLMADFDSAVKLDHIACVRADRPSSNLNRVSVVE